MPRKSAPPPKKGKKRHPPSPKGWRKESPRPFSRRGNSDTSKPISPARAVEDTTRARPGRAHAGGARSDIWIYGLHSVRAALENPLRRCHRLLLTTTAAEELAQAVGRRRLAPQMLDNSALSDLLPAGAVHQGAALQADPLPDAALEELIERSMAGAGPMLLLDQISDPHNVGAILRSAAAFGVAGLVLLERHAPPLTGVLAKAASGGLEHVALARVTNLARCLEDVAEAGLCVIGLDEHAGQDLAQVKRDNAGKAFALVLGAEGRGMRRLTREKCHFLARLACPGPLGSLNVSNAAAVALYELTA